MTLFTQCVYTPSTDSTTLRISVMSRHTHNDGLTPDFRIQYDLWLQDLAPPDRLVGAWYREKISEEQFTAAYRAYLQQQPQRHTLDLLIELALTSKRKPTLLCVEPRDQFCHRQLLAFYCQQLAPQLSVVHL